MVNIIIGEKVINKTRETGTIVYCDNNCLQVDFGNRVSKFLLNAFEQGFLKYENSEVQKQVFEAIEEKAKVEQQRIIDEKEKIRQWLINSMGTEPLYNVDNTKVTIMRDVYPARFANVPKEDAKLLQATFNECDNDTAALLDSFEPIMTYSKLTSKGKSKYSIGFLTKYTNTYVMRVFMRNDIFKKGVRAGVTLLQCDTSEILRVVMVNGNLYFFIKNVKTRAGNYSVDTQRYGIWTQTSLYDDFNLNEMIRKCDCQYLNEYIPEENVSLKTHMPLLFSALYSNKAEIVFKHKLFSSTYRIQNIGKYFEAFSPKHIDFACKNNVVNALPIIKSCGERDLYVLSNIELIMENRGGGSIYNRIKDICSYHRLDIAELDRRLIKFLKKFKAHENFEVNIYSGYIFALRRLINVTMDDLFDKNYIQRHDEMMQDSMVRYSNNQNESYKQIAQELSWIDREENGYFIMVPKSIESFKYEGMQQHNCVFACEYFNDVIARRSIIVFLRKEKTTSFVTIEFDYITFKVRQAFGKYNQKLEKELFDYIVDLGKRLNVERLSLQ